MRRLPIIAVLLTVVAAWATPAEAQSPQDRQRYVVLIRQGVEALQQEDQDLETALQKFHEAHKLWPTEPTAPYNLACSYALGGAPDDAFQWLEKALELGFDDMEHVKSDPDLQSLHDDPRWQRLVSGDRDDDDPDAVPVHLVHPAEPGDAQRPVVVLLHPYGTQHTWMMRQFRGAADDLGAVLVSVRGSRSLGGGRWAWDAGDGDAALDLVARLAERRGDMDTDRIILAGFSQGAYTALRTGLRHPRKVTGILSIGGIWDAEQFEPLLADAAAAGLRVHLVHGNADRQAPLEDMWRGAEAMERAGIPVHRRSFDGGHTLPEGPAAGCLSDLRTLLDTAPDEEPDTPDDDRPRRRRF